MIKNPEENPIHTARVGETLYNIDMLSSFAETLPIEVVSTDSLKDAVGEGHKYWLDEAGNMFGPSEILVDWEAAQRNPLWVKHIESIRHANLNNPIWIASDGLVFDGMHRLTAAFIQGAIEVKIRRFQQLPDEGIIAE